LLPLAGSGGVVVLPVGFAAARWKHKATPRMNKISNMTDKE
jgi:hypothetical protein